MTARSLARCIAAATLILLSTVWTVQAGTEDEVKSLFGKFIAAQNAHDLKAVGEILQDSSQFLWINRGAPVWGREAALKRFEENYKGTWVLEPKLEEVKITELSPVVAQLFVPAVFTIAPAGQVAQPRRFLMTQIYVKTANGWKLSTTVPVFVP